MASENSNTTLNTGTEKLRNDLFARNLYAPDTEYPLQNKKNVDRVVGAINTVIKGITPFNSWDLTNTVYGRIITTSTPMTEIGLEMLGKQFALNSMSSIAQSTFPTMKVTNLFDGSKDTKLFTRNKNFSITKKEGQTNFQTFLNNAVYYYPGRDYPFTKTTTNSDIIKNTGTAQLYSMYTNINRNPYKQTNRLDTTFVEYAEVADTQIFPRSSVINTGITTVYNFNDAKFDPYSRLGIINNTVLVNANNSMINSILYMDGDYGPDANYYDFVLGQTSKVDLNRVWGSQVTENEWISEVVEFAAEARPEDTILWGRDGITPEVNKRSAQYRGDVGEEPTFTPDLKSFNVRSGLLEYTRNLINSTEGKIGDLTKKAFVKDGLLSGFQGSALWKSNDSVYAASRQLAGKSGTRQHTAIDQYDRFVKAIRFNGNKVYNGSENSVIYKSVLPKIHPTMDEEGINNRDMMFSIENLAVVVNSSGMIDDEWGSEIPLCEVGPFGGRVMWFPPYNLEMNESSVAKYEPTVMIGRNEPMYNYMHSERNATITFTLLVDYPDQLKNFKGGDRQRQIAEFFAFGGEEYLDNSRKTIESLDLKIAKLQLQINSIQGGTKMADPDVKNPSPLNLYFPNDVPKVGDDLASLANDLYNTYKYEIIEDSVSSDGGTYGFNKNVFFKTGMTTYNRSGTTMYSASTVVQQDNPSTEDQFGKQILNNVLLDIYSNEENRPLYDLYFVGTASKLYTELNPDDINEEETYNDALGVRRATAFREFVESRLLTLFGAGSQGLGITVHESTEGSDNASASGATAAAIPLRETKLERSASVTIKRNTKTRPLKEVPLSEEDRETLLQLQIEIEAAQTELSRLKGRGEACVYEERPIPNGDSDAADTGILHGFKSVSGNYYQPVFHSQTPEDFHKRLTFLQQCTRQGSAKKYDVVNEEGNLRAKNSVFGRQPICIMRIGDFFHTKIVLETVTIDYADTTWDMNPEGFGMQPMIANVTLNMKVIGGQSLKGPIDALQNANSYNYYANSSFTSKGRYELPSRMADEQAAYREAVITAENNSTTSNEAILEKQVNNEE